MSPPQVMGWVDWHGPPARIPSFVTPLPEKSKAMEQSGQLVAKSFNSGYKPQPFVKFGLFLTVRSLLGPRNETKLERLSMFCSIGLLDMSSVTPPPLAIRISRRD